MKKFLLGIILTVLAVPTVFANYMPSAELEARVDVVETALMDILLESSESTAMGFVALLESYETRFMTEMNERNLYIVQKLMYDIRPMVYCVFNGGAYLTGVRECEDIDMATCDMVGGMYNECGSACRNEPDGSVCTLQCVPYCNMMPDDKTMVTATPTTTAQNLVTEAENQTRLIDSMKVDCTGVGPQKCFQVTRIDNQNDLNTVLFYEDIDGFDYKEGFKYRIEVNVMTLDKNTVPTDASTMRYQLLNIISETVDGDVCSSYYDGCNNCNVVMNSQGDYISACTKMACSIQGPVECTTFKNNMNMMPTTETDCSSNNPAGGNCFNK